MAHRIVYVSDSYQSYVYGFTYPQGSPFGPIISKDLAQPQGACVDKAGNIWVANSGASDIIGFSHPAKKPKKILADPGSVPSDCAIDPRTGNLAVANAGNTGSQNGTVAIYRAASGRPTQYTDASLVRAFFCTYDDRGNLFLDGFTREGFGLAELPAGRTSFKNIKVQQPIYFPGAVQWDGQYIAVGDQGRSKVYELAIEGRAATVVGTTRLLHASDVVQFWLVRSGGRAIQLVAPDAADHDVKVYSYPAGGSPTSTFTGQNMYEPVGAVVTSD